MALTRRGFIGLLSTGLVGACVVTKVPTGWIPEPIRKRVACDYLRREFNAWVGAHKDFPGGLIAGRELYEAFEGELIRNERFTLASARGDGEPSLVFKGRRLKARGRGWTVRVLSRHEWAAEGHS